MVVIKNKLIIGGYKMQDCDKCKKCNMFCPLIIIGPGVREHTKEYIEFEEKTRKDWEKEMEPLFEKMLKAHPELKTKKMVDDFVKEDVAKIIDVLNKQFARVLEERQSQKYKIEEEPVTKTKLFKVDE
jgi:Na+-translocating ferredoxin:NAD+ oxidoreductase RnfC subunit